MLQDSEIQLEKKNEVRKKKSVSVPRSIKKEKKKREKKDSSYPK